MKRFYQIMLLAFLAIGAIAIISSFRQLSFKLTELNSAMKQQQAKLEEGDGVLQEMRIKLSRLNSTENMKIEPTFRIVMAGIYLTFMFLCRNMVYYISQYVEMRVLSMFNFSIFTKSFICLLFYFSSFTNIQVKMLNNLLLVRS